MATCAANPMDDRHLSPRAPLAKLSAPEPTGIVARERLFLQLDAATRVAWITAPAGSGKTMLAASWLRARGLPMLWYRVDEGDSDPASFFAYLGEAAAALAPDKARGLPLLTPENALNAKLFARKFFRRLFQELPSNACLALDDYHELPPEAALHEILGAALEEVPPGCRVLATSRAQPPAALARLRSQGHLAVLDWNALRLNPEETLAIAQARLPKPGLDLADGRELHQHCDGWVTGLILLLERSLRKKLASGDEPVAFAYFASEILARLPPSTRAFLQRVALLPVMRAQTAAQLGERDDAALVLADLAQRNFFTFRYHDEGAERYQFHPLFRQFLLDRGQAGNSPDTWRAAQCHAASILLEEDDLPAAVALLAAAKDWSAMANAVIAKAPQLLFQGRLETLKHCLEVFPDNAYNDHPWLHHFAGECHLQLDPRRARPCFERAYAGFKDRDNVRGLYLSWAGLTFTYLHLFEGFSGMAPWLEEFDGLRERYSDFPDSFTELRVWAAAVGVSDMCRPRDPRLPEWTHRLETLAMASSEPYARVMAAIRLLFHCTWWDIDFTRATRLLTLFAPSAAACEAFPVAQMLWEIARVHHDWITADPTAYGATMARAKKVEKQSGVALLSFQLAVQAAWEPAFEQNWEEAAKRLEWARTGLTTTRATDAMQYHWLKLLLAKTRGDTYEVQEQGRALHRLSFRVEAPVATALGLLGRISERLASGASDEVPELLHEALEQARAAASAIILWDALFVAAEIAAAMESEAAQRSRLRELFEFGRTHGLVSCQVLVWQPTLAAALCQQAIEADILPDYARWLVKRHRLCPRVAPYHLAQWPWPLRVFTLGRFEIHRDGQPLVFQASRGPTKPLELLKALVALGGVEVPQEKIADLLWPDAEGDAARNAFYTNLDRLRVLIGRDTLVLRGGRLSLDTRRAWTDLAALDAIALRCRAGQADVQEIELALHAYQGTFLPHDHALSWIAEARRRIGRQQSAHLANLAQAAAHAASPNRRGD